METKMIGNKIAEARKRLNISQAQLAESLFISAQAVGKWERGESLPDIITLNRLAEIFGVDLNFFAVNSPTFADDGTPSVLSLGNETATGKSVPQQKPKPDMSKMNLADGDFSGLKNLHEKFSASNMQRCRFTGSDMAGLLLTGNNVDQCDFTRADLSHCQIQRSYFAHSQFNGSSLKETEFSGSFISDCDFTDADFTGVTVKSGGLEKNKLENTTWLRTRFTDSHLVETTFEGTVEDCVFENCAFTKVTFQHATILNTFFKNNRKLKKVNFIDCKADSISYAFLKSGQADLSGVTLITP
jgi:uncharacterized protein YjbI with pentapeptide repeats